MGKRRNEPGLIEIAAKSGWQFSAVISIGALLLGLVVVPIITRGNLVLATLAPLGRMFGFLVAGVFGLISIARFVQQRSEAPSQPFSPAPYARRTTVTRAEPSSSRTSGLPLRDFNPPLRAEPFVTPKPRAWSLELLQTIEWKRFEEVVAAYFREKNFRCETLEFGADGGVDGRLFFGDMDKPVGVVQCKAWNTRQVGVAPVRELLGVMAHEKVARGYFATTGTFSEEAIRFAAANPIKLISGVDFLAAIAAMDSERQAKLLAVSTEGEYTVPTCPSCGIKLFRKTFQNGGAAWVCTRYPACKVKIPAKRV